jgi:adenine phosphoribosyltransferase
MPDERITRVEQLIRDVPDFPKPGIIFKDITTVLRDPEGLRLTIELFRDALGERPVDAVVAMESRGFIFGVPLALALGVGFVPVRKPGKLPAEVERESYELEYGTDQLEIHRDALKPGQRVAVVDDLLATGGTAAATVRLVRRLGADVAAAAFLVELDFLEGRTKLSDVDVCSIVHY